MRRRGAVLAVFLLAMLFPTLVGRATGLYQAAVTLVRFEAIDYSAPFVLIEIQWETASELNSAGFYVTRSLSSTSGFARISDFYPSQGDDLTGSIYTHTDEDVTVGIVYYYKLEMIDTGNLSTFTDPIGAAIGGTPTVSVSTHTATATATATPTNTVTPTPSPTGSTSTPTLTPTRTATSAFTPTRTYTYTPFAVVTFTRVPTQTPTATEEATATSTYTPRPTETTTLIPLPSITLVFLPLTETPTPTPTAIFLRTPTHTLTPTPPPPPPKMPMRVSFLAVVVGLLWLCLGVFLVIYLQKSRTLL